jgi:hypothetical protein
MLKKNFAESAIIEIESNDNDKAMNILEASGIIKNTAYFGNKLHAAVSSADENTLSSAISKIKNTLTLSGVDVKRIERIPPSLEDVFVNLLGK